jgi:curved DNA-binding protein CbpA
MSEVESDDYYKVLGVAKDASEQDLKKAYRKLAIKWHPDKNLTNKDVAEENFKRVAEAYEALSDTEKRAAYDRWGKEALQGGGSGHQGGGGEGMHGFSRVDPNDLFAQFFGGEDPFSDLFSSIVMGGMGGPGMTIRINGRPVGGRSRRNPFVGIRGVQSMSRQRRERPGFIPEGTRVKLKGFSSESASTMNNASAEILGFDEGRYIVKVDAPPRRTFGVMVDNLVQLVKSVRIEGLQSRSDLNGKTADIIGWDNSSERYAVKLCSTDEQVSVKQTNLVVPAKTCVVVVGLQSATEHNGETATVESFDSTAGRYVVELSDGRKLRVRPANARV